MIQNGLFPGDDPEEEEEEENAAEKTNTNECENLKITDMNSQQLHSKLRAIYDRIANINTLATNSTETGISTGSIKHCRMCTHAMNLHVCKKNQPKKCKLCPDGLCNKDCESQPCNCQQHLLCSPVAMQCSVSVPGKDMVEIFLPVSNKSFECDNKAVSYVTSAFLATAFLKGLVHQLMLSRIAETFSDLIQDAADVVKMMKLDKLDITVSLQKIEPLQFIASKI